MSAEEAVQAALMEMLRADAGVQAVFGSPARVFDAESEAPMFPHALLERHEVTPEDAALVKGAAHRISLAVYTREGGVRGAKAAVAALRRAVEGASWSVPGVHIVLAHVVYGDVMRTADKRAFRGLIRIRIISEEMA
ncbi:DUF3168 domain-containing protein [Hyphomonas pacifica]|uniref:Gene transfer agent protein n=1 Tax=Hyphomonas pacifica TaxID=1280941 RepID=A0A062TYG7_9PROT|nr:DUF3168 domain-containing protein [Hyphomonas pacifica]KCZ46859.1 hypothetical protein HY2_05610 [Hyphomonas pacifica]RAN30476.1 hypothetical protein HY3_06585 [Hyphomonas pacifica]RAN31861.1 hypothetical protein HY11_06670 [Hyphomonas pacifica]